MIGRYDGKASMSLNHTKPTLLYSTSMYVRSNLTSNDYRYWIKNELTFGLAFAMRFVHVTFSYEYNTYYKTFIINLETTGCHSTMFNCSLRLRSIVLYF